MSERKQVYYQVNFSIHGVRIEVEFPAKDVNHHEQRRQNAISLTEAKMIAGESGFIYKKTTTFKLIEEVSTLIE